jgi:galactokinase
MNEYEWKQIWEILNELKDENGFITFPMSVEYNLTEDMKFYTDDVFRMICEELDPIDAEDTNLAQDMLRGIGVNV